MQKKYFDWLNRVFEADKYPEEGEINPKHFDFIFEKFTQYHRHLYDCGSGRWYCWDGYKDNGTGGWVPDLKLKTMVGSLRHMLNKYFRFADAEVFGHEDLYNEHLCVIRCVEDDEFVAKVFRLYGEYMEKCVRNGSMV